jgi:hypothetical protein
MMESLCSVFYKIDRSTKSSRQAEYIIRCSMLDVRCSMFISFFFDLTGRCSDQWRRSYETSFQKLELFLSWATLHFVGWVELTQSSVGFRCTQPNLHFATVFAKCETQQQPISEPVPNSFFFDLTGRPRPAAALSSRYLYWVINYSAQQHQNIRISLKQPNMFNPYPVWLFFRAE